VKIMPRRFANPRQLSMRLPLFPGPEGLKPHLKTGTWKQRLRGVQTHKHAAVFGRLVRAARCNVWTHKGAPAGTLPACLSATNCFSISVFSLYSLYCTPVLSVGTDGETWVESPPQLTSYRPISDAHPTRRQENGTD